MSKIIVQPECHMCCEPAHWCKLCQENYCEKCHKINEDSWEVSEYLSPHQWYAKEILV